MSQSYVIVTSNRDAVPVLAVADALRRVGHDVVIKNAVEESALSATCAGVVFVECDDANLIVEIATHAFSQGVAVAAIGGAVAAIADAGLARGRTISAPGSSRNELGGGAERSSNDVAGDNTLITASGAHAVDDLVRMLRQLTETPVAQDAETLTEVLNDFATLGYSASATVESAGRMTCIACSATTDAGLLRVDIMRRLEGASDPDDQLVAVAAQCPNCGARLALVLGYGPNASAEDTAALQALPEPELTP
jgi:DJ-1/PfpI family